MMNCYLNNQPMTVYETEEFLYAIAAAAGEKALLRVDAPAETLTVRPLSLGLRFASQEEASVLQAPVPSKLCLECSSWQKPLFVFLYTPEETPASGEHLRILLPGIHDAERLVLGSGDTVYLCEGACLTGKLYAENAENITVCGRGIIDVSSYPERGRRVLLFRGVRGLTVRDVTVVGACAWSIQLNGCENVHIDGVNLLSWKVCGDGVDVVGSHDVRIENIFARTADDCIALKATDYNGKEGLADVYNVTARRCVLWNAHPGNGIEIGFETRCDEIRDVLFEDIDILRCEFEGWQSGGVLTIHNGDRAHIHDITYRNIRIECAEEKLIDFKVQNSRYSKDEKRGIIERITLEDIAVTGGELVPSILQGHTDAGCEVRDVTLRRVSYKGRMLKNRTDLHLIAERSKQIVFTEE